MINPAAAIRRLSSSHRLYLIGGILIAATIAAACLAVWDRRAQTIKSYEREVTNLSITLAEQLARSMQAVDLVLQETQSKLAAAGVDSAAQFSRRVAAEEIHRFFAQQLSNLPQADGTALIDADGFMIASSREWPVPRLDASDRDYYVHFRDHDDRGVFISAPARTRVTGVWAFFMARRLDGPHGEFLGIVVGAIDLQYFEEFYKSITLERGGSVNILRRDGTMLARYPHVEDMMGKKLPPGARWYAAIGNGGGSFWTPGYVDGVARVVSTYPVHDYPLAVAVTVPENAVLAEWRRFATVVSIAAGFVAVCFATLFGALAAGSRKTERQAAALADAAGALQKSETRFRGFAMTSSDWFWETDEHHRFTFMSAGLRASFSTDPGSVIGRTRLELAADAGSDMAKWEQHLVVLERHEPFRDFVYTWRNPGREGIASISGDPFFDADGRFLGYRGSGRDITELKATEMQLHQTEEDLNRAQRLAQVGSDVWDLRTGDVTWSAETYRIFGVDPGEFTPTTENFLDFVVPEDRPNLLIRRKQILQGKCPAACEFSIRRPDGEVRGIYSEAELVLDENGRPVRWVGVRQDVTAQRRAERGLREAKEAAEAANAAKSEFLANMSHELRTPLNAIIGFSEALETGIVGTLRPNQAEYIRIVCNSGRHLLDVINDILDLAKVDAGKFELREEDCVDPRRILDTCVTLVKAHADAGAVRLSTVFEDNLPLVVADPTRLKQILLNLLSNAIKFTERGGSVATAIRRSTRGGIVFEVRDTGCGMTEEEIGIALQPFRQLEATHTRQHGGTGLGLPLAQRLAELHGGSLQIESEKGRGTTVTVRLPSIRVLITRPVESIATDTAA
jgi:two-component system sensor histidine kinase/response regulator